MGESDRAVTILVVAPDEAAGPDPDRLAAALDADVVTADAADAALDVIDLVDCVVSVLDLPSADGLELLESVQRVAPGLPFVLCPVGSVDDDVASRAVAAGVTEYVPLDGPDGRDRLIDRIRAAVGRSDGTTITGYDRAFDQSPAAIVIYDERGHIRYANRTAAEIAGVEDPAAILGVSIERFVADEAIERVRDRLRTVIEDRESVERTELPLEDVAGERVYVEVAGAPVTYAGQPAGQAVLTDVTARKERAERLRAERDKFTRLFDAIPAAVAHVELDGATPIVRRVNPAFERTFDYEEEDIVGAPLDEFVVPEDRRDEAAELNQAIVEGERIEVELTRSGADGIRDFIFHAVPLDDGENGRPAEGLGIYVDITERKERERDLEEKNERLDAFAGVVSHDLRNPLNVICGRLDLARETGAEEHFEAIDRASRRMERLIDNLLSLAREGETVGTTRKVSLGFVSRSAWADVDTGAASLVVREDVTVEADTDRLADLLANLFRNAVEHGGPDVTIEVGPTAEGFYVADDGPGIPAGDRERIFEMGYSTGETGMGYGLTIVQRIASAHGWDVSVGESEHGGARFEIGA